jgi:hypothetical protein
VHPHRAGLKNMPGHGANRIYDLWNTSPIYGINSYGSPDLINARITAENIKFPKEKWPLNQLKYGLRTKMEGLSK